MPTGYTAVINDRPDVTFEEFALNCARAFGALIALRDDPLDKPIPDDVGFNSSYHATALKDAHDRYAMLESMSDDEADLAASTEYAEQVQSKQEGISKAEDLRFRYQQMLKKVKAWTPPTADHHRLKDFMVQQIEDSMRFDCSASYYHEMEVKRLSGKEWRQKEREQALRNIDRHATEQQKDEARDRERNEWVRQLRESLVSPAPDSNSDRGEGDSVVNEQTASMA